ncbi:MAG TPA: polymer-forming cytoskeletal protein [Rectinemataceae bacterium]
MPRALKSVPDEEEIDTVLEADLEFSGSLSTDKDLLVKGRLKGTVNCGEELYIAPGAIVDAEVHARSIVVRGTLYGSALAAESIQMMAGSSGSALLEAPEIVIDEQSSFSGTTTISRCADNA